MTRAVRVNRQFRAIQGEVGGIRGQSHVADEAVAAVE